MRVAYVKNICRKIQSTIEDSPVQISNWFLIKIIKLTINHCIVSMRNKKSLFHDTVEICRGLMHMLWLNLQILYARSFFVQLPNWKYCHQHVDTASFIIMLLFVSLLPYSNDKHSPPTYFLPISDIHGRMSMHGIFL